MIENSYCDYMDDISKEELYKGLVSNGLFSTNLPPIFTSEPFFDYLSLRGVPSEERRSNYISFDFNRSSGIPRRFGIPNPFSYAILCNFIRDNWDTIRQHFRNQTCQQSHKISQIHIRKMRDTKSLFQMNYSNWNKDGDFSEDLLIGAKYEVFADISTCFPSLYTHSLPWAIIGKDAAKKEMREEKSWRTKWYNKLDELCRNMRNGETHGIMIGPHVSNLLSEIVLVNIDNNLYSRGWRFVRFIDDYRCFVGSVEAGQRFITDLVKALQEFDLQLNQKKTRVVKLPTRFSEKWIQSLTLLDVGKLDRINCKSVKAYLDTAIEIVNNNNNDAAPLKYAIKALSSSIQKMDAQAQLFLGKAIMHLCFIYPCLLQIADEFVLSRVGIDNATLSNFISRIYDESKLVNNYEGMCYSLFMALNHGCLIDAFDIDYVLQSDNCILKLFAWIYCLNRNRNLDMGSLRYDALTILDEENIDANWLFVYEVLDGDELKGEWADLKKANVSFVKPEFLDGSKSI